MIDAHRPHTTDAAQSNPAGVYNYLVGGSHNTATDRHFAETALRLTPDIGEWALLNRAFMARAARYCWDRGVRQFLDLGAGAPAPGALHEILPSARVVYVDNDPAVIGALRESLAGHESVASVAADLRDSATVLNNPGARRLIDLSQPVAVMMIACLHFVSDDEDASRCVADFREWMAPGSYLALTHGTMDSTAGVREATELVARYSATTTPLTPRPEHEIVGLFTGLDLVEPGVVFLPDWHPSDSDTRPGERARRGGLAGVGRKPKPKPTTVPAPDRTKPR